MAAALGTFRINVNGRIKCVSAYASDAAAVLVKFDESKIAVAGSNDKIVLPNGGTLVDVCMTSDLATPTHIQLLVNGVPTGDILDVTAHLASVVTRPNPVLAIPAGAQLQAMQIS